MKLKAPNVPIESGGIVEQGEFRIKNSATAFAILSSGLYSNKFKAILRELGCNAYDSHVEAGYPEKPFTVHLPTSLNPILSVRDYGTGLAHDDVMNLYTTYFESTKNDSNDFVGCMGLGSKSPFSYTKNFTITSIKDGWKGIYSAFIGEQGVPNISQLTSEKTDEHNGLEVSFAVNNRRDIQQFRHEIADTYKWFKTHPEITGDEVQIPEIVYSEENIIEGASLTDEKGYYAKSYAVMGNVAYPIKIPDGEDVSKQVRNLYNNNGFVVRFEIGDLDIAASREELGYVPHTIENLVEKAEQIMLALEVYVENKIKPAKTKWERNILATELLDSNQELFGEIIDRYMKKHPRKFVKGSMKNYHSIKFTLPLAEIEAVDGLRVTYKTVRHGYGVHPVNLTNIKSESADKPKHLRSKAKTKNTGYMPGYDPDHRWQVYNIDPKNTTILFNDEVGNILQRIKLALTDEDTKKLFKNSILVCAPQNRHADRAKLLKFITSRCGNPKVVLASELPEIVKNVGSLNGNLSITVQKFKEVYHRWGDNKQTFETVFSKLKDLEPTIVNGKKKIYLYLKLSHKGVIKPYEDKKTPLWTATTIWDCIESFDLATMADIDMSKVYGVNKTSFKTVTGSSQWVNLFDYLQQQFDKIDWKEARGATERKLIKREFSNESFDPKHVPKDQFEEIEKTNTPAGKLFAEWKAYNALIPTTKISNKTPQIQYDRVIIGMDDMFPAVDFAKSSSKLDVKGIEGKYSKLFKEFRIKYPMLSHLSLESQYYNGKQDWRDAINYIELVDSVK